MTLGNSSGTFLEILRETGEHYIDLSPEKYTSVFEGTNTIPQTGQLLLVTIANTIQPAGSLIGDVIRYVNINIRMRYTDA